MGVREGFLPCFLIAILVTLNPVEAASECGLNSQEANLRQLCDNQSADEVARQKEYAEFEANYSALVAKKNTQRRAEDLGTLKNLTADDFCVTYGEVVRGGMPRYLVAEGYADGELLSILKKQAKSRRLHFDDAVIERRTLRMGMTTCALYASLGRPIVENRTTGSWGRHIQHVYGKYDEFVYTDNGRVSGWQD